MWNGVTWKKVRAFGLRVTWLAFWLLWCQYGHSQSTGAGRKLFSVLQELNQQRKIYFFLTDASMGDWPVDAVQYQSNEPLTRILDRLLEKTNLHYRLLNEQTVIIYPRNSLPLDVSNNNNEKNGPDSPNAGSLWLRGRVLNTDSLPIVQATVRVNDAVGSYTNGAGYFRLPVKRNQELIVSCVGYETVRIPLNALSFHVPLSVVLPYRQTEMEEVIVTGFDVQRKAKSLGYPVNVVRSSQINIPAHTNVAAALYGKAPGVRVQSAPGGATSAVQIQVRGLNSLNFNSQPIYFLDGVAIRNANERGVKGINNGGYWDDPRIRGNGVLDINPQDIETITILKGASATALYGSEAANGVVLINSKKAMPGQGVRVHFNYAATVEQLAQLPHYQEKYGPGYDPVTNLSEGADEAGWIPVDRDGDGIAESRRPNFSSWAQFGPELDGTAVTWWDGTLRPYRLHHDNYKVFYQTGYSSQANLSLSNHSDKGGYRFSYSRHDYRGIQVGGDLLRHSLNFSTQWKVTPKFSMDLVTHYTHSRVHNRPYQLNRLLASYAGFLSRAEDPALLLEKYKTSEEYKWVSWNRPEINPAEALHYPMKTEALDFLWMQLRNQENEDQDRMINSFTFQYRITPRLHLRARLGNDFTSFRLDVRRYNEYPTAFNVVNSTGLYRTQNGRYGILYGDALLSYDVPVHRNWSLRLNAGYQTRREKYTDELATTTGGLLKENWFSLDNSFNAVNSETDRTELLKYAYLGFANISYRNFLFAEATARLEYSSTLPIDNNHYFYASGNTAFVFTERWKKLKRWLHSGKLRMSYGVVGNAPPVYAAALTYAQTVLPTVNGPVAAQGVQPNIGNPLIRPENKYEWEAGLDMQWWQGRLGVDVNWYRNRIPNQIVQLTVPASSGAFSQLINAGELRSEGWEIYVHAMPVRKKNINWQIHFNAARNRTYVSELGRNVNEVVYFNGEQQSVKIVALPGRDVGEILVYPQVRDAQGQPLVGANGLYVMDKSRYERAGNIMPKWMGGLSQSLQWKGFSLEHTIDFRWGGHMVSPVAKYNTGAGMYTSTLRYRDEAHGGLPYYIDAGGSKVLLSSHQSAAPGGAEVHHDGIILPGVDLDGKPNTMIVDAAYYYMNMFGWGPDAMNREGMIFKNNYIKMRELVLSYNWKPGGRIRECRVSLVGRNLFYIYRTLKNMDPETAIGSNWSRQAIDEGTMAANRSWGLSFQLVF